jgi:5-keto 4-deoxyuronate isomerase
MENSHANCSLGVRRLAFTGSLDGRTDLRVVSVDPTTAKVGDIVTVNGDAIDKGNVDTLYLTDGKTDIKVEMTEQSAKAIKFKVPDAAKAHRWAVMVHTTKDQLIEEPVRVTIE